MTADISFAASFAGSVMSLCTTQCIKSQEAKSQVRRKVIACMIMTDHDFMIIRSKGIANYLARWRDLWSKFSVDTNSSITKSFKSIP